jgi:hypothetical protein
MDHENEACVPYKYSRYGVYSSHLFLLNAIFNYIYGFKILTCLGTALYTSSILHWRNIKHDGIFKWLDVTSCITTVFYVTLVDSFYFSLNHRYAWLTAKSIAVCAYGVNKYVERYQLTGVCVPAVVTSVPDAITYKYGVFEENEPYRYFCLKYAKPNSRHRDSAYLYGVFVHIIFLHVPLAFTCIYGVSNSITCEAPLVSAPLSAPLSICE